MHPVVIFDFISLLASLSALVILLSNWKRALEHDIKLLLTGLFVCNVFYSFCLVTEWSGLTRALDPYEDIIGAMLPMWWVFIFYAFLQQLAAQDLQQSEEDYRDLFNNADEIIQSVSPDGPILKVNRKWFEIFGYREDELQNLLIWDLIHPDSISICKTAFRTVLSGETITRLKMTFLAKDGTAIPVEGNVNCRLEDQKPVFIRCIFRDIRERQKAMDALKESEKRYRQLFQHAPAAIFEVDLQNHRLLSVNDVMSGYTGYSKDQLLEKDLFDLFADDSLKIFSERQRMLQEGKSVPPSQEYEFKKKDGSTMWAMLNMSYEVENGLPVKARVVAHDITEQKAMDEALRESEEKYRILVEHANDAIFIIQDETVKFPNPKTLEMMGYSTAELANTSFVDFIHPEDRDMVLKRYKRRLAGEEVSNPYSFRIKCKGGDNIRVQLNSALVNWEGRPATLNFMRDITQERKLEAQLQKAQRMEAVGTLSGGVAHDFNNLLMGIQGNISLMSIGAGTSHPHFKRIKNIEQHVQKGAGLTKQLLGFAKGDKYKVTPTDLNDLVEKSSEMFSRTKKEIIIHRKLQEDIWTVEVDPTQIEQVLLNLYVNAWQAMPGKGKLLLETQNIVLDENRVQPYQLTPGRYVKMSVADTGIGMSKKLQERIFEPFFTTKGTGKGTGLGLASAYGIVKNHDGIIDVYSEIGEGTTFNIYLPSSEKSIVKEDVFDREILKGTETILFVDDEETIVDIGRQIIESLGYEVLISGGGVEAIDVFRKNFDRIDMVVLDMIMPDMGGGDTYDMLKKIDPEAKVLLSSGYSVDGQASQILSRGCDGFIQKPFNLKELSHKLRDVLDNKENHGTLNDHKQNGQNSKLGINQPRCDGPVI
jgi:two-component system cell cycle sensor histidine kinase/response regulator CckA